MTATLVRIAEDLLREFKKDSLPYTFVETQLKRLHSAADKKSNKKTIDDIRLKVSKREKAKKQRKAKQAAEE